MHKDGANNGQDCMIMHELRNEPKVECNNSLNPQLRLLLALPECVKNHVIPSNV